MLNGICKVPFLRHLRWVLLNHKYLFSKYVHIGHMSVIKDSVINNYVSIGDSSSICDSIIGNFSYVGSNSSISKTFIGKFCSIGSYVVINAGSHPTKFVSTSPVFYNKSNKFSLASSSANQYSEYDNVKIGNDVWIGERAFIMGGLSIGDGSIIATNAVVTRNVPSYSIVGGIPSRIIKYRFSDEVIKKLLGINWWDKDIYWLKKNIDLMNDVEGFLRTVYLQKVINNQ